MKRLLIGLGLVLAFVTNSFAVITSAKIITPAYIGQTTVTHTMEFFTTATVTKKIALFQDNLHTSKGLTALTTSTLTGLILPNGTDGNVLTEYGSGHTKWAALPGSSNTFTITPTGSGAGQGSISVNPATNGGSGGNTLQDWVVGSDIAARFDASGNLLIDPGDIFAPLIRIGSVFYMDQYTISFNGGSYLQDDSHGLLSINSTTTTLGSVLQLDSSGMIIRDMGVTPTLGIEEVRQYQNGANLFFSYKPTGSAQRNISLPLAKSGTISLGGMTVLFADYADHACSGSGETTLFSGSIPASTFGTNGTTISFEDCGIFSSAITNKEIKVYFGTAGDNTDTLIYDSTLLLFVSADWNLSGTIIDSGTNTQRCSVRFNSSATGLSLVGSKYTETPKTESSIQKITITGQGGASSEVVNKLCKGWVLGTP